MNQQVIFSCFFIFILLFQAILFEDTLFVSAQESDVTIPAWFANPIEWWGQDLISDQEFGLNLEHLIKNEVISSPSFSIIETEEALIEYRGGGDETTVRELAPVSKYNIPVFFKNNAIWWTEGKITDSDLIYGIENLIENGIIVTPNIKIVTPCPEVELDEPSLQLDLITGDFILGSLLPFDFAFGEEAPCPGFSVVNSNAIFIQDPPFSKEPMAVFKWALEFNDGTRAVNKEMVVGLYENVSFDEGDVTNPSGGWIYFAPPTVHELVSNDDGVITLNSTDIVPGDQIAVILVKNKKSGDPDNFSTSPPNYLTLKIPDLEIVNKEIKYFYYENNSYIGYLSAKYELKWLEKPYIAEIFPRQHANDPISGVGGINYPPSIENTKIKTSYEDGWTVILVKDLGNPGDKVGYELYFRDYLDPINNSLQTIKIPDALTEQILIPGITVSALTAEDGPSFTLDKYYPPEAFLCLNAAGTVDLADGEFTANAAGIIISPDITNTGNSPGQTVPGPDGHPFAALLIGNNELSFVPFFNPSESSSDEQVVSQQKTLQELFRKGIEEGASLEFKINDSEFNNNSGQFAISNC